MRIADAGLTDASLTTTTRFSGGYWRRSNAQCLTLTCRRNASRSCGHSFLDELAINMLFAVRPWDDSKNGVIQTDRLSDLMVAICEDVRRGERERFWPAEVQSKEHAKKITQLTAFAFGLLSLAMWLRGLAPFDHAMILTALLFGAPAMSLYLHNSSWAVWVFLALALSSVTTFSGLGIHAFATGSVVTAVTSIVALPIWVSLLFATFRALKAVRYLKRVSA